METLFNLKRREGCMVDAYLLQSEGPALVVILLLALLAIKLLEEWGMMKV